MNICTDNEEQLIARCAFQAFRSSDDYMSLLELRGQDLQGKRILDLCSGPTQAFAQHAEIFFGAHVDCVSFGESNIQRVQGAQRGKYFNALASALPVDADSYDLVVSLWGMPAYAPFEDGAECSMREAMRVLRPGGQVRTFPAAHLVPNRTLFSSFFPQFHRSSKEVQRRLQRLFSSLHHQHPEMPQAVLMEEYDWQDWSSEQAQKIMNLVGCTEYALKPVLGDMHQTLIARK